MSWWAWLLISIGLYFATGVAVASIFSYIEGLHDADHPTRSDPGYTQDSADTIACALLWPFVMIAAPIIWAGKLFKFTYQRGKTRKVRKVERLGRKNQDAALKELCKQNGWDYRKIKATQSPNTLVG